MQRRLTTLAGQAITLAIAVTWSTHRPERRSATPIVTVDIDLGTDVNTG